MATLAATTSKPEVREKTLEQLTKFQALRHPPPEILEKHFEQFGLKPLIPSVDQKTMMGIEVEVENVLKFGANAQLLVWQLKQDNSLRNRGQELVSHPIPSSFVSQALQLLFKELNGDIEFSKRTSIHFHMNARNLTLDNIFGILYAYHVVEPLFFKFVGGNRVNNIFCVPWTNSDVFGHATSGAGKLGSLKYLSTHSAKYCALNLTPLFSYGTLEFRHMIGTNDIKKITQWANLILSLKLFALRNTSDVIAGSICNLNTNSQYQKFLEDIFGENSALLDQGSLAVDMERQVTDIKMSAVSSKFHLETWEKLQNPEAVKGSQMQKVAEKLGFGFNKKKNNYRIMTFQSARDSRGRTWRLSRNGIEWEQYTRDGDIEQIIDRNAFYQAYHEEMRNVYGNAVVDIDFQDVIQELAALNARREDAVRRVRIDLERRAVETAAPRDGVQLGAGDMLNANRWVNEVQARVPEQPPQFFWNNANVAVEEVMVHGNPRVVPDPIPNPVPPQGLRPDPTRLRAGPRAVNINGLVFVQEEVGNNQRRWIHRNGAGAPGQHHPAGALGDGRLHPIPRELNIIQHRGRWIIENWPTWRDQVFPNQPENREVEF